MTEKDNSDTDNVDRNNNSSSTGLLDEDIPVKKYISYQKE